jgi:hypothetical protein
MAQKLQAVNEVLQRLGKLPVKFLDTGGTSTHSHVERLINNASDMVQGQGWGWNTKTNVDIGANSSSNLQVNNLELGSSKSLTAATAAKPCVITTSSKHGLETGDEVYITGVVGMVEINDRSYQVSRLSSTTFELNGEDSSEHTTWSSGGTSRKSNHIYHVDTVGSDSDKNFSRRGDKMYNEDDQTFVITGTYKMGYIYQFDFEEVPDSFQKWIIAQAAYDFNRYYLGNQSHDQLLADEIADTKRQATREEIRASDINVLNQAPMNQIRGRNRMPDRSIY